MIGYCWHFCSDPKYQAMLAFEELEGFLIAQHNRNLLLTMRKKQGKPKICRKTQSCLTSILSLRKQSAYRALTLCVRICKNSTYSTAGLAASEWEVLQQLHLFFPHRDCWSGSYCHIKACTCHIETLLLIVILSSASQYCPIHCFSTLYTGKFYGTISKAWTPFLTALFMRLKNNTCLSFPLNLLSVNQPTYSPLSPKILWLIN